MDGGRDEWRVGGWMKVIAKTWYFYENKTTETVCPMTPKLEESLESFRGISRASKAQGETHVRMRQAIVFF